jgi:branched-chain amino acid transport system substrate-binding protein
VRVAYLGDYALEEAPALVAPAYQGASLAAERATDAGGLPVGLEVVAFDTEGDPLAALDIAGEIAADPEFVAVVIAPFTEQPGSVGEVLDAAGLPTISLSSSDAGLSERGWSSWRRAVATDVEQARGVAAVARGLASTSRGVCLAGDGSARAVALQREAARELDDVVAARVVVPPSDASAAAGAAAVRRAGCRVVLWTGFGAPAAALRLRLAPGPRVDLVATDAVKTDAYLVETGRAGDGTIAACACVDLTTSAKLNSQRFINAFQFDIGTSPGPYAVEGWDVGNLLADVVRRGAVSREQVRAELSRIRSFAGLAGTYAFREDGELVPASSSIRFFRAEGGRWIGLGSQDGATPFELRRDGRLTVGSCRWGAPFAFRRAGALRGFDVDIARTLAHRLGLELDWRRLSCRAQRRALDRDRVDALAAVRLPTPPGAERTRIYDSQRQALAVDRRRRPRVRRVAHLRQGDSVGIVRGSAGAAWARREIRTRGLGLEPFSRARRALAALRAGDVDAVLVDAWRAHARADRWGWLRSAQSIDAGDYRAFAVPIDAAGLLASLDGELGDLLRGRAYERAYARWFPGNPVPREVGSA